MAEELVVTQEPETEEIVPKVAALSPTLRIGLAVAAMLLVATITTVAGFLLFKTR